MRSWSSWQDLIWNSLTAFSFRWNLCYKSLILFGDVASSSSATEVDCYPQVEPTLGQNTSLAGDGVMQDGNQEYKPEWGEYEESGQLLFLGIFLQLWWQNSSFDPFSLLSTVCPLVQYLDQERSWADWDLSGFAVLGTLLPVPVPAAHCCQHCLLWWGRGEMLNSACKQLACSTALQLYISSDAAQACTRGWGF